MLLFPYLAMQDKWSLGADQQFTTYINQVAEGKNRVHMYPLLDLFFAYLFTIHFLIRVPSH